MTKIFRRSISRIESDRWLTYDPDVKDKKLLWYLSQNYRLPLNTLAKLTRLSKDAIKYRMNRLIKEKVIVGAIPVINMPIFGYGTYILLLKTQGLQQQTEKKLVDFFIKHRSAIWVVKVAGSWDFIVWFVARSYTEFSKIFDDLKSNFGDYLKEYSLLNTTEDYYYSHLPKDAISGVEIKPIKAKKSDFSFQKRLEGMPVELSCTDKIEKISKIDIQILEALSDDTRIRLIDLAKKLELSVETVRSHMENMITKNILQGFMPFISIARLGYQWYGLLIRVKKMNAEERIKWINFCKNNPYIVWASHNLGQWDVFIEINCKDIMRLYDIISDITTNFEVSDTQALIFLEEYKYTHFVDAYYDLVD